MTLIKEIKVQHHLHKVRSLLQQHLKPKKESLFVLAWRTEKGLKKLDQMVEI